MKNLGRVGGFSLVEVLFALFVGGLLMSAVYLVMISGQKSSTGVERKVAAQQDVRAALDIMAMEISMASYNPYLALPSQIWVNPTTCTGATANPQYKGIQVAGPMAITVEMDIGSVGANPNQEDGLISAPNEIISYAYNDASQTITRSASLGLANCGTATPFLGGGTNAVAGTKTVNLINNDATTPIKNKANNAAIFRYYDSNLNELDPGTTPTDIPNIRRIDITLAVQTEEKDPSTNAYRKMIYSTSVLVRNHAL
jgi:prepilin-type N-terminal cleavage/methylation domain-containing protein